MIIKDYVSAQERLNLSVMKSKIVHVLHIISISTITMIALAALDEMYNLMVLN